MERRSTSDLLRELQAITAELARRHGVGQANGGEALQKDPQHPGQVLEGQQQLGRSRPRSSQHRLDRRTSRVAQSLLLWTSMLVWRRVPSRKIMAAIPTDRAKR